MAEKGVTSGRLVGFLVVEKTPKADGFIAALMVTDDRGYPLEFRATTPVRPTLVQRTLYGKRLEHYVGVELCGKTLITQSSRKPKTILVPERELLDIANEVEPDIVAIRRAGDALQLEDEGLDVGGRGTISVAGYQPIVYECRLADPDSRSETVARLQDWCARFDLVEAFERMRAALQLLAKEDSRYA